MTSQSNKFNLKGIKDSVPWQEAPVLVNSYTSVNASSAENYGCYQIESNQLNTSESSFPCR